MKRFAIAIVQLATLAVAATASAHGDGAQAQVKATSAASAPKSPSRAHGTPHKRKAPHGAPAPGSDTDGMSKNPGEADKPDNPDNMPVKRPDSTTNDRMLHDQLPSDAIAR
jgi:hypothetical protein